MSFRSPARSSKVFWAASIALSAAVPALIEVLADGDTTTQATAADVLGDIGCEAGPAERALITALSNSEQAVRLNAAHALGTIGGNGQRVGVLADALSTEQDEWVRRYVALSLLRLGPNAADAVPQLKRAVQTDDNRYVQAKSLETLKRIGTIESMSAAVELLETLRWCPQTGIGSTF